MAYAYPKLGKKYLHIDFNKERNCSNLSKLPVHIQLPLRQPNPPHKPPFLKQPIKHINGNNKPTSRRSSSRNKNASSDILRLMDSLGLPISPDMYLSLIKECTLGCESATALELHSHVMRSGLKLTLPLLNHLLIMLVSCGHLDAACQMFDQMTVKRDFVSWAIIMIGYFDNACYDDAITLFVKMVYSSCGVLELPTWAMLCVLKACVETVNKGLGKQIHGLLLKLGRMDDLSLGASLINFYGKLKCLEDANFVFDQLLHPNIATWTVKIVNNCREGNFYNALNVFKEMGSAGIRKNSFTFSIVLKACARIHDYGICGRQVHANAIKLGLESDVFVQCGLIDMYGKCGIVQDAKLVFKLIPDKQNVAHWNAMFMVYMMHRHYIEALTLLYQMKAAGLEVQESLINEVRIACGSEFLERNKTLR